MNASSLIPFVFLLFALTACSTPPEPRPRAFEDAQQLLRNGTQAFYNDEYRNASQNFQQALQLYQSIDDATGIINSRINLIETQLAMGQLEAAQTGIDQVKAQLILTPDRSHQKRVTLLLSRLEYQKNRIDKAIELLQTIAPDFNDQQQAIKRDQHSLPVVSALARYTRQANNSDATLWLTRFEKLIDDKANDSYQALLYRLKAQNLIEQLQFDSALSLLDRSLELDRKQAYRRGLSEALSLKAQVAQLTRQLELADQLYQRTLTVQLWIQDRSGVKHSLEQLIEINRQLNHADKVNHFISRLDQMKQAMQ